MNWYDNLNDSQRAKVLAFALGFLHSTSITNELKVSAFHNKKYATSLLKHLETEANSLLLDQLNEGID